MKGERRVVVILEAKEPRYLALLGNRLRKSPIVDEIRILSEARTPGLKSEILHLKYRDAERIKVIEEKTVSHLMKRCTREDTLYVFLGEDVIWFSKEALENLCDTHVTWTDHLITFMSKAAADRTGYLMQIMGMLPDALLQPWHADYIFTFKLDHPAIQQEAHEKILFLAQTNQIQRLNFDRFLLEPYERGHSSAFCFTGEDMSAASFFIKSKETHSVSDLVRKISEVALTDSTRVNALCGGAWVAEADERARTVTERYLRLKEESDA